MTSNENQGKISNQKIGLSSAAVAFRGEKLETGSARLRTRDAAVKCRAATSFLVLKGCDFI